MKSFSRFITESTKSHYNNEQGHVVLLTPLGDYEGMKRHGKKAKKLKEALSDSHYSDADENVGEIGRLTGGTGLNEKEFNEASILSDKLIETKGEISPAHKDKLKIYSMGSRQLNKSLIKAHKDGHTNFEEHDPMRKHALQNTHAAIMNNLHSPGQHLSLYSGTPHNFGDVAKQSKDGIVHSPAHISASHDIDVGMHFARQTAGWKQNDENPAHMVHIRVKPHQKILHMSDHSDYPAEHESIVPAGTKLKYSHTTEHWGRTDPVNDPIGKRSPVHIHHFDIHDPWIKT